MVDILSLEVFFPVRFYIKNKITIISWLFYKRDEDKMKYHGLLLDCKGIKVKHINALIWCKFGQISITSNANLTS